MWFDILKQIRGVQEEVGYVTSQHLARRTGKTVAVCSGWLAKMVKWGYLLREGSMPKRKRCKRWLRVFKLTRAGWDREPPVMRQVYVRRGQ